MSEPTRRDGPRYRLTDADIDAFHENGYVHLPGVLSESEIAEVETEYMPMALTFLDPPTLI